MKRPLCWLAAVMLTGAYLWFGGREPAPVFQAQDQVQLKGIVAEKQLQETSYGSYLQVTLKQVSFLYGGQTEGGEGSVLGKEAGLEGQYLCRLKKEEFPDLKMGQEIILAGTFQEWEKATNPGQFDLGKWYLSKGIRGQLDKCIVLYKEKEYSVWRETLWQARQWGTNVFTAQLGERDGSLIAAMVTGEKEGMDEDLKTLYQRNGISHILSISGLHFMFLGMGLFGILQKCAFGVKKAAILSSCIMILYCILTGSSVSTCRAAVMFLLMLTAKRIGRSYDTLSALGLAAILQIIKNPYSMWDSGFQLSFLAVAGVSLLPPCLQHLFPKAGKLGKSLMVSVAAALTTIPVLLYHYGTYSWHSIFLNLLIVPAMSLLLAMAILLLGIEILSVFCPVIVIIKPIFVIGIRAILFYYETCCNLCEKLPIQAVGAGRPSFVFILLYYLLLAVVVINVKKGKKVWWKLLLLAAPLLLLIKTSDGVRITMLDVGQGDGIVIENDNGNVYISDCGSSSVNQVGKYRLLPFLKCMGYREIEGIFVSHLDQDHINGIQELLQLAPEEDITVQHLFLPISVQNIEVQKEVLDALLEQAKLAGVSVVFLAQGDYIRDGAMTFRCLYPGTRNLHDNSSNNASLVLSLDYGEFNMLLTGDIEEKGEEKLLSTLGQSVDYEVLKVAHHGSNSSTSEQILKNINPKVSLISYGKDNFYGHPSEVVVERLLQSGSLVLETGKSGAITIYPDKNGTCTIDPFLSAEIR